MKEFTVSEETFFQVLEELQASGAKVVRCVEIAGKGEYKQYHIVYIQR